MRDIGSVATVQRRLGRLKHLGIVRQSRAAQDRRVQRLTISPKVWTLDVRLGRRMEAIWARGDG